MRAFTAVLTLLAASNAVAANLLTNPDFDEDLTGWGGGNVTATWDEFDVDGRDDSGSAKIVSSVPFGSVGSLNSGCVVVSAETDYTLTGWSFIPADALNTRNFVYTISIYSSFDCSSGFLLFIQPIAGGTVGEWILTEEVITTPAGANSTRVGVGPVPFEDEIGDAVAFVDSITLPEPASTVLQASALALLAALATWRRRLRATGCPASRSGPASQSLAMGPRRGDWRGDSPLRTSVDREPSDALKALSAYVDALGTAS